MCVYIFTGETTNQTEVVYYLMATVHESVRLASERGPGELLVYPYSRHTYDDKPGDYYKSVCTTTKLQLYSVYRLYSITYSGILL